MRSFIFISICFIASTIISGQTQKSFSLKWKLKDNETLVYKTQTDNLDTANFKFLELNLSKIKNSLKISDSSVVKLPGQHQVNRSSQDTCKTENLFHDFTKALEDINNNYNFFSILSKDIHHKIDIKMLIKKAVETPENSFADSLILLFRKANKGVVLRGQLNENGSIASFYMKQEQKNMLAIYFELPTYMVKVGDKWPLEINLLQFDQNFIFENAEKRNQVTLVDVKDINNEQIAYLSYDIYEKAEGEMNNPTGGENIPICYEMSFQGLCEFSITNGRWKSFSILSKTNITGFTESHSFQKIQLLPQDEMNLKDIYNNK